MSSGSYSSYSSSEATKEPETDDIDEACLTETPEMIDRVEKVMVYKYTNFKSISLFISINNDLVICELQANSSVNKIFI